MRNFSLLPPEDMRESCPCCNLPLTAPKFPLCCDLRELSELGAGFPMYFYFVKNALFMLVLVLLIAGIPCLVDNVRQGRGGEWGGAG